MSARFDFFLYGGLVISGLAIMKFGPRPSFARVRIPDVVYVPLPLTEEMKKKECASIRDSDRESANVRYSTCIHRQVGIQNCSYWRGVCADRRQMSKEAAQEDYVKCMIDAQK